MTATTSELPAPIAYGPTLLVAGREDCALSPPAVDLTRTTDPDGTIRLRDGRFECAVTNSDPRIAGTAYYTLDMDRWGTSPEDTSQAMWGTIRIENDGGAWEAGYVGVYTNEWGDVFTALFTGSGGYEGLSYYQWAVETYGASWPTKGLVFPGDTSTFPDPEIAIDDVIAASASNTDSTAEYDLPDAIAYGPTALTAGWEQCHLNPPAIRPTESRDADGTLHIQNLGFTCTVSNNDPRIAGTVHFTLNLDRWGTTEHHAAQVFWGTVRIENEGGAWDSEYLGVYTTEWGDVDAGLFIGSGEYEGLSYYQWVVETHGASWPTKGLIFPSSS